jgi:hypothetical protein
LQTAAETRKGFAAMKSSDFIASTTCLEKYLLDPVTGNLKWKKTCPQ